MVAVYRIVPQAALRGQSHRAAHLVSNTGQADQAWSLTDQAGIPPSPPPPRCIRGEPFMVFLHTVRRFLTSYFITLLLCNGVWRRRGGNTVIRTLLCCFSVVPPEQDSIPSISSSQSIFPIAIVSRRACLK